MSQRNSRASFYVRRERSFDGRVGWTGPIRGLTQANREADAWDQAETLNPATGQHERAWEAEVLPSTPETRRRVREWQRDRQAVIA
jgi:hypothetical protein